MLMSKEQADLFRGRLLRLANFIDGLSDGAFYFGQWLDAGDDQKKCANPENIIPNASCGTTACALGWATAMPEFRNLGLVFHGDVDGFLCPYIEGESNEDATAFERVVQTTKYLFGLNRQETERLFLPADDHDRILTSVGEIVEYTAQARGLLISANQHEYAAFLRHFISLWEPECYEFGVRTERDHEDSEDS